MKSIEISTERLLLKPLGHKYLRTVMDYAMDREGIRYMTYLPYESTDEVATFLRRVDSEWEKDESAFYEFAIFYQDNHIGAVTIYFENGIGELGWILGERYRGNGFGYEAAAALIKIFLNQFWNKPFCRTLRHEKHSLAQNNGEARDDSNQQTWWKKEQKCTV